MPTPHVYRRRCGHRACYGRSQRGAAIIAAAVNVTLQSLQARST